MRICCVSLHCESALRPKIRHSFLILLKGLSKHISYNFPFYRMIFQGSLSYFTFFHNITVDTAGGVMIHKNYFCGRICIRVIISNELLSKSTYF